MARIRRSSSRGIALWAFALFCCPLVIAQDTRKPDTDHPRPVLVIDPGMHTAPIHSAATDTSGRFIATASVDKTIRIWDAEDGKLQRTIYVPAGSDQIGAMYAVAFDPRNNVVAAGGWTREGYWIYLLNRDTGALERRISGLPNVATRLAFSPDGRYLVAGTLGIRVFDRTKDWSVVAADDYDLPVYALAFAPDGRVATASDDGHVRLYNERFQLMAKHHRAQKPGKPLPRTLAFRPPDGEVLAVGFVTDGMPQVDDPISLLHGRTLKQLVGPPQKESLSYSQAVVWSLDGNTLFSMDGRLMTWSGVGSPLLSFDAMGHGPPREFGDSVDMNVTTLATLPEGRLMVAGGNKPYLAVLNSDGRIRWAHRTSTAEFPGSSLINVSTSGETVDFRFGANTQVLRFDATSLKVSDVTKASPLQRDRPPSKLRISIFTGEASVNGKPILLGDSEQPTAVAVHPKDDRFILGTTSNLYSLTDTGAVTWRRFVPGRVADVTVAKNGQVVIATLQDGTIRWYRYTDGVELLAFMPLSHRSEDYDEIVPLDAMRWVAWTPDGFYATAPHTGDVLGWLVDRGANAVGLRVPVSAIPKQYRPDALALVIREMDIIRALGLAEYASARAAVGRATGVEPGARLHVLSIGIDDYGKHAPDLRLAYARKDAEDFVETLTSTQASTLDGRAAVPYAEVLPTYLPDPQATREHILESVDTLRYNMAKGNGQDVAVILFAGHGKTSADGTFYLLPYGVDTSSTSSFEASAISIAQLRDKVEKLAAHGQVILLLDACRSGAATNRISSIQTNADVLRSAFSGNVIVLTSSKGTEASRELPELQHGVFTYLLLQALKGAADDSKTGKITVVDLINYLSTNLPRLTNDKQHLGVSPVQNMQRILFSVVQ